MNITVIIPVRNEEGTIGELIEKLLNQSLRPAEIVICDGGSTDRTLEVISEYVNSGAPIRLISDGAALPGRGRNLAANVASNEWLAFIDAGTTPVTTWLESLASAAQSEDDTSIVYGSYKPVVDTFYKQCATIAYVAPPTQINGHLTRSRSTASLLITRSAWQAAGGFREDLRSAEDLLFFLKLDELNTCSVCAPEALVHWQVQGTPWLTFKRFIVYARSNMRAGLWRYWQAPVLTRYALLLVSALPAFWVGAKWLIVTIGLWVLMLFARAAVAVWRNRTCYPAGPITNLARVLLLAPLIAMIDAATLHGTLMWAVKDKLDL
ncbi:MAG: glycosyltransferase [Pyrinomonadaceae bacterium]